MHRKRRIVSTKIPFNLRFTLLKAGGKYNKLVDPKNRLICKKKIGLRHKNRRLIITLEKSVSILKAKLALIRMYNYAKKHDIALYNYLNKNKKYLLKNPMLLVKDSLELNQQIKIGKNSLNIKKIDNTKLVCLPKKFSTKITKNVNNRAGVYCFIHNKTNTICYVGSTIDLPRRLENHYSAAKKSNTKFYNFVLSQGGFSAFSIYFLNVFDNSVFEYFKINKMKNPHTDYILNCFTKFEARIIEQAFINYLLPRFNTGVRVNFEFANWSRKNTLTTISTLFSIPVRAITEKNKVFKFTSITKASKKLNIAHSTILRKCNGIKPYYLFSPTLNKNVHFIIDLLPKIELAPKKILTKPVYIADITEKILLNKGEPFKSLKFAGDFLNLNSAVISKAISDKSLLKSKYICSFQPITSFDRPKNRFVPLYVYDKEWNILNNGKPFIHSAEAASVLGLKKTTVKTAHFRGSLCSGKYYFLSEPKQ